MNVLPARMTGQIHTRKSSDRQVIVSDPDLGPVVVRWQLGREQPWRCRECGPRSVADCAHTFAAGLLLAEVLLGLTPITDSNSETRQREDAR